jgi:hypothetical protein
MAEMLTVDPRIVALCAETSLTEPDIADLMAITDPRDMAAIMKAYADMGKVPAGGGFWQSLADGIKTLNEYAPLLAVLVAAIPLL